MILTKQQQSHEHAVGLVIHTKSSDCNLLIIKSAHADHVAAVMVKGGSIRTWITLISNKQETSATTRHLPRVYHLIQRLSEGLQYAYCIITEISGFTSIPSSPQTRQQVGGVCAPEMTL